MKKLWICMVISGLFSIMLGCALAEDGSRVLMRDVPTREELENGTATVLGSDILRSEISSITFMDREIDPSSEDAYGFTWDVSEAQDGSVMATYYGMDELCYDALIISADGGVIANPDSSYLFAGYDLYQINFNNTIFDTSGVTNMSHMFENFSVGDAFNDYVELKLLGFDTNSVEDMTAMFAGCDDLKRIWIDDGFVYDEEAEKDLFPPHARIRKTKRQTGKNVLRSDETLYYDGSSYVLNSKIERYQICSITFVDTLANAPADAWDVSVSHDGSVQAWVTVDDISPHDYNLFIGANGKIIANQNSQELFCNYWNADEIHFNGCFDTSQVINMRRMFEGSFEEAPLLDFTELDTKNVVDATNAFNPSPRGYIGRWHYLNLSGMDFSNVELFFNNNGDILGPIAGMVTKLNIANTKISDDIIETFLEKVYGRLTVQTLIVDESFKPTEEMKVLMNENGVEVIVQEEKTGDQKRESKSGIEVEANKELSFRTGPNTSYVELYTLPQDTDIVAYESEYGNGVEWVMLEYTYNGNVCRAYTGMERISAGAEIAEANPMNIGITLNKPQDVYSAPTELAEIRDTVDESYEITLLEYDGEYALVDYYDSQSKAYNRGYIKADSISETDDMRAATESQELYDQGVEYYINSEYEEAWECFLEAADMGHAGAMAQLGVMYSFDRGVGGSNRRAAKWFQKAAAAGNADAQYNLGVMYINGDGRFVASDDKLAEEYFRLGASKGDANSWYGLAQMYFTGRIGIGADYEQALSCCEKAAELGSVEALADIEYYSKEEHYNKKEYNRKSIMIDPLVPRIGLFLQEDEIDLGAEEVKLHGTIYTVGEIDPDALAMNVADNYVVPKLEKTENGYTFEITCAMDMTGKDKIEVQAFVQMHPEIETVQLAVPIHVPKAAQPVMTSDVPNVE